MNQYIRINEDNEAVLDYDELDTAARANFIEDAHRLAKTIEMDLDDPDFSNAEKVEGINDAAIVAVQHLSIETDEGDEAEWNGDTKQMFIDIIVRDLASRHNVEL